MLEPLLEELRLAIRRTRRAAGLSAAAVLTLALGVGVNAALFELVYGALVAPLRYPEPERVVSVWEGNPERGRLRFGISTPAWLETAARHELLTGLLAWNGSGANLWDGRRATRIELASVAGDLPRVLGVTPRLGRWFDAAEAAAGATAPVVLSESFWRGSLGGDPQVLQRELRLDGVPRRVVGVLPHTVAAPFEEHQVFAPLWLDAADQGRGTRWLAALGRTAPGVSPEQLQAALDADADRLAREHPQTNRGWRFEVTPLAEVLSEAARPALLSAWAAAGLVLLIACANTAQLLLARALARRGEMAVRAALGASAWRLARLALIESLLLAGLGAGAGLLAAAAARPALLAVASQALAAPPPRAPLALLLGFGIAAALLSGLLAGLLPARAALTGRLSAALRGAAPGAVGAATGRGPAALVVGQVALAVVLVLGAGLLLRSASALLQLDPGFEARDRLVLRVAPPGQPPRPGETLEQFLERRDTELARAADFYQRLREELGALPGVRGVAAVNRLPLTGRWWSIGLAVEGPPARPGEAPSAWGRAVTPGFFQTLGIPLRAGRDFDARDVRRSEPVVVVDALLAWRLWPGRDPLGQRLQLDAPEGEWARVVGVAGNVRLSRLEEEPEPFFYVPLAQAQFGFFPDWGADVVVHSAGDAAALAGPVRERVQALQAELPVFDVRTLEQLLQTRLGRRLGAQRLLAASGLAAALVLATRQRRREIGLRLALGAAPARVRRELRLAALRLTLAGVVAGLALAALAAPALRAQLYGVTPLDPPANLGAAAPLLLLGALAAELPARRAARIEPSLALRED